MKIHAIQTGTVTIKPSQCVGRGRGSMRQLNILLDRSWTEPLPIYAWAIETADGVVVVDTGETARTRGDTSYSQANLIERRVDGVSPSVAISLQTLDTILRYAQDRPTVYLPAHDPDSGLRLAARRLVNDL
jgi:glyoxylase-like metal-dependent hydrolase (beta-lactamase superfamily II)